MYCVECRESGRRPWEHAPGCTEGLKQTLRLYEIGFALVIAVLVLETVLMVVGFRKACT